MWRGGGSPRRWRRVWSITPFLVGVFLMLSGIVVLDTAVGASDLNPAGPGNESIRLLSDTPSPPILMDAVSSATSSGDASSLTFSHTVGDVTNRMLLVGAQAQDSTASDCDVVSVTYNATSLTKADEAIAGTASLVCVDLWYLIAPDTGTHDVVVTWNGIVAHRIGGGISLINAAQQAPEATGSSTQDSAGSITTSVTTLTDDAWLIDAVGMDAAGIGFAPGESNQIERYDETSAASAGAGSSKPVNTAGSADVSWSNDTSALAHAVAAIAQAP